MGILDYFLKRQQQVQFQEIPNFNHGEIWISAIEKRF